MSIKKVGTHPRHVCVVLLPGFTEYPDFSFWNLLFYNKQECCSRFADAVFHGRIDLLGKRSMEAIINDNCAEIPYFFIFGYLLYLVSFMSIVTLDCDRMKLDAKVKKLR